MTLELLRQYGTQFARYKSMEFAGPTVAALTIEERMTICNMSTEMGAKACIFAPDETTRSYLSRVGVDMDESELCSDGEVSYQQRIELDLGGLVPLIAAPHNPANVGPIGDYTGTRVTQAFIGSCTNGSLSDLAVAAEVLRHRKVAPHVQLFVTPATAEVLRIARAEGYLDIFEAAGAI